MATQISTKPDHAVTEALSNLFSAICDVLEESGDCKLTSEELDLASGRFQAVTLSALAMLPVQTVAQIAADMWAATR